MSRSGFRSGRRGWPALVAETALAAVVAVGCATSTRLPSEPYTRAVLSGQGAIVLLRLQGEVDGKPPKLSESAAWRAAFWEGAETQQFLLRLTNLDDASARGVRVSLLAPSELAARNGWAYLELGPGSYFLELPPFSKAPAPSWPRSPTGRFGRIYRGEFIPVLALRLDVRAGEHVVYAGTLALSVSTQRGPAWRTPPEYPEYKVQINDESAAARDVFGQSFAPLGFSVFVTRLAQLYDQMLPEQAMRVLSPVGLATAGSEHIERISWRGRAMGIWLAPSGALAVGGLQLGYGGAGLVMLGLAYAPIGAVGGLISGELAERQKGPCVEALSKELLELRPEEHLASRIREGFAGHLLDVPIQVEWSPASPRPGGQEGFRSLLLANITRVKLQEAELGMFYVEVAMRARLWEIAGARWAYDRSFIYGLPDRQWPSRRPYEVPVLESASPRKLDAYCAADGRLLFRDDVGHAIDALAKRLVEELGVTEPLSGR